MRDDRSDADAALKAGQWAEAAVLYGPLAAAGGDACAQEGLAQAAWWLDDADLALGAREAAYRTFRSTGDARGAARAAATLGYDSLLFGKGAAVGRGWLARAADLLGEQAAVPEAGWLAVRQAEFALAVDHDAVTGLDASTRAREVGDDTADGDLMIVSQALGGLARVRLGDVAAGMRLLDAAAAAATAGDVEDLMWVGKICCWLIAACQETHDLGRAGDWCARVEDICVQRELAPLFAVCRTQYASILLAGGNSQEAETTLVDVLERLRESRRLSRYDAVAQLGELRRRQGRLAEAEDLLQQAGYRPAAVTSLAQLRLDDGDAARAWSTITELLRSISTGQLLERVDALAVAVAAGVAVGSVDEARSAADELRVIATKVGTPALIAHADAAEARLAGGERAVEQWQDAARHFHAAGLTFDEADARLQLAGALSAVGDEARAHEQEELARAALSPLRGTEGRRAVGPGTLTERQSQVLRLVARGLSNSEIAAALHLSEHTVHRHIANIYVALDLGSRAAAAAYAVSHGLG
jgi:DNA-binding CsgD family transcriptional regulator